MSRSARSDDSDEDEGTSLRLPSSRIQRLFSTRPDEFFIELEEPHKTYAPGDSVRGRVYISLAKDIKTVSVALRLQGKVKFGAGKNFATTILCEENILLFGTPDQDRPPWSDSHQNKACAQLNSEGQGSLVTGDLNDISSEAGSVSSKTRTKGLKPSSMQAGRHVFDFDCSLPSKALPSTIDFGRGSISYTIRCRMQKPSTISSRGRSYCRKDITVLEPIDIGQIPTPKIRHIDPDSKSKRKEGTGRIHAFVQITKGGYLKGETIVLNIQVKHIKPIKNMHGTIATLYRLSRFDSHEMAPQSFRKDLSQSVLPLLVDPATLDYKVSLRLRMPPDAFPTTISAVSVSFRYFVEVVLDLNARNTVWQSGVGPNVTEAGSFDSGIHTIDTDVVKRERGAHCVVFEVIVGTKETIRRVDTSASWRSRRSNSFSGALTGSAYSVSDHGSTNGARNQYNAQEAGPSLNGQDFPLSKEALQSIEATLLPSNPPMAAYPQDSQSTEPLVPQLQSLSIHSQELAYPLSHDTRCDTSGVEEAQGGANHRGEDSIEDNINFTYSSQTNPSAQREKSDILHLQPSDPLPSEEEAEADSRFGVPTLEDIGYTAPELPNYR